MNYQLMIAGNEHIHLAEDICRMIAKAAEQRGTGIAKRDPEYIKRKIQEGKAIIALDKTRPIGFCYIETWQNKKYVANSGLIVDSEYRGIGLAKKIKEKAFRLSRKKYPGTRLFGITTSLAVMKINSSLGYKPVTFSELTRDEDFWKGCKSCPNFEILKSNQYKNCLCTGMLYDPSSREIKNGERLHLLNKYYRWVRMKQYSVFKKLKLKKS